MSNGNPRQAEILVRQFAKMGTTTITEEDAEEALAA
jgi:hypothetical protein